MVAQVRVVSAAVVRANDVVKASLVPSPTGPADVAELSAIQQLLRLIFGHLEAGDCESAKPLFLTLSNCLTVIQGHRSRPRGGIQFRPDFMLDAVHFADMLKPLQDETDVMRVALQKTLTQIQQM